MAKYIFANNGRVSGKASGNVLLRNGVERAYVSPTNTVSSYKQLQIDALTSYSMAWQTLTQDEMKLWHNFSIIHKDAFNNNIYVSGNQAFISCNYYLALIHNDNTTIWIDTPVTNSVPPPAMNFTFTATKSAPTIIVTNTSNLNPRKVILSATLNLSQGVFKPRQCEFRDIGIFDFNTPIVDIYPEYFTRLSSTPNVGSKLFIRSKVISDYGLVSTIFQTSAIAT